MPEPAPQLSRLLGASESRERDQAWKEFVAEHSRLLLHVARSVNRDRDEAMDAYAFILESLSAAEFARLRAFAADGRSKFSTWLVVVARRLCLDHHRQRFGRARDEQSDSARQDLALRHRLGRLAGENIELSELAAAAMGADERLSAGEVRAALAASLDTLPAADRCLLALRFEDDLSAQQIARIMHFPTPFHVYRRLEVVTKTLRALLTARGIESAAP
jgi:RNA polymerase sigma factor (sigma-70 family)